MLSGLSERVIPATQRRSLADLTEDLDLTAGDSTSKKSAFWVMLVLSAVIASAGVLSDSTATVIGAMIIAPLSTPIMGMALAVAKREPGGLTRAGRFVLLGALVVIGIGAVFALVLPSSYDLLGNPQIAGRTSPGLLDLTAAVATGFAGAVAIARKDVAAVLPGVAIAISLAPPLAVVGVCTGQRSFGLATGALLLFLEPAGSGARRNARVHNPGAAGACGRAGRIIAPPGVPDDLDPAGRGGGPAGGQYHRHLPDQRLDEPHPQHC